MGKGNIITRKKADIPQIFSQRALDERSGVTHAPENIGKMGQKMNCLSIQINTVYPSLLYTKLWLTSLLLRS